MPGAEVLIVEDEPNWQDNLSRIVRSAGLDCKIAATYFDALQLLHSMDPAVITLDLSLRTDDYREAEWQGWKVAEQAQVRGIPIIIVSSHAGAVRISKAFRKFELLMFFFDKLEFRDRIDTFETTLIEAVFHKGNQSGQREMAPADSQGDAATAVESVVSIPLPKLRQLIIDSFNESELRDLAFDLELNFSSLGGDSDTDKARELILLMERQGRLERLLAYVKEKRPYIRWD